MLPLFVVSNQPYTGKTFLTLGLALNLKERGYDIGYVKPIGKLPVKMGSDFVDEEAVFIKNLLNLENSLKEVSPFVFTYQIQYEMYEKHCLPKVKEKVVEAIKSQQDKDFVFVVMGDTIFEGYSLEIDPASLIREVGGKILAVELWSGETSLDNFFGMKNCFRESFIGGVINKVPPNAYEFVKEKFVLFAKKKGVEVLGVFSREKTLEAVSVKTLLEVVNGGILCGEDKLEELVENFSVGAMDPESAFQYFLRIPNKAVITGTQRTDIQILALETSTKCLILTGGLVVSETILARAKEKGVPVIVTELDTFSVVDRIEKLMGKAMIKERSKALRAKELVAQHFDFDSFLKEVFK